MIFNIFRIVSIRKTIWVNFRLFPLKEFILFHIIVGRNVRILNLKNIEVFDLYKGRIHLGTSPLFNVSTKEEIVINNNGKLKIGGNVIVQPGCILFTDKKGTIELKGNNRIGARTQILSKRSIVIEENTGISWDCQICDSDFHFIENLESHKILSNTKSITIGKNVWIGNHVIVGKGVTIGDNNIIGQNSYVNKSMDDKNRIIVGSPARYLNGKYARIWDLKMEQSLQDKCDQYDTQYSNNANEK